MNRTLAAAFAAGLTFTLLGGVALAHARFASSTPGPGQTLAASPAAVVITFTEELADGSTGTVTDAAGARVDTAATIDANVQTKMSIALKPSLPNGVYKVNWHSIAADDKAVLDGSFFFGVGVPAPSTSTAASGWPALALLVAGLAVLAATFAASRRSFAIP